MCPARLPLLLSCLEVAAGLLLTILSFFIRPYGYAAEAATPGDYDSGNPYGYTPSSYGGYPGTTPGSAYTAGTPSFDDGRTPGGGGLDYSPAYFGTPAAPASYGGASAAYGGASAAYGGGVADYGASSGGGGAGGSGGAGGDWLVVGMVVAGAATSNFAGVRGVVVEASPGACSVRKLDGAVIRLPEAAAEPVAPLKNDRVIVLGGDLAGQVGTLINIDSLEGIVKVGGSAYQGGRQWEVCHQLTSCVRCSWTTTTSRSCTWRSCASFRERGWWGVLRFFFVASRWFKSTHCNSHTPDSTPVEGD